MPDSRPAPGATDTLARAILDLLAARAPADRIAARAELDGLGPPAAVDAALQQLQDDLRVGSPALGWYMPVTRQTDRYGLPRLMPPADLHSLLRGILERNGVTPVPSQAAREYQAASAAGLGPGVPNGVHVGVDRPFPLALHWGPGMAITEYAGESMDMATPTHSDAFAIKEPDAFTRACLARSLCPQRIEKDLYVNRMLKAVGDWNREQGPDFGVALALGGGTGLTKSGSPLARFSEDIDLAVLLPGQDPALPIDAFTVEAVTASMYTWLRDRFPDVPAFQAAGVSPLTRPGVCVQQLRYGYRPVSPVAQGFPPVDQGLAVELDFWPAAGLEPALTRPGVNWRRMTNRPNPLGVSQVTIDALPAVPPSYILAGKLMALGVSVQMYEYGYPPGPVDRTRIRHPLDLYSLRATLSEFDGRILTVMRGMQAKEHGLDAPLAWGLLQRVGSQLASWRLHGADAYSRYVKAMFLPADVPEILAAEKDVYAYTATLIDDLARLDGHDMADGADRERGLL